ncbi:MAG: metallophosphoesterase family protein [Cyanobacteria bacterium P01_D01_bin.123]
MHWAILSGIEGNVAAYEAVLKDIQRQKYRVSDLFVLGDFVGLKGDNQAVIERLRSPRSGELPPQVCVGWWEEQCFSLHGLNRLPDAPELMAREGGNGVRVLWKSVPRESVLWMRSLHFGFHEFDCLLIHGSTVSYADELTPETPAIQLCDRLIRADANRLFCGRSGLTFDCEVFPHQLKSSVTTLDGSQEPVDQGKTPRRVVGVGSVGRTRGLASYTVYHPGSDRVTFKTVRYGQARGFAPTSKERSSAQP